MDEQKYLRPKQAREYLGVKEATFWNIVKRNNLTKYKENSISREVFYDKQELDRVKAEIRNPTDFKVLPSNAA